MGTYPEPPSYVLSTGEELQTAIDKDPDTLLGKNIIRKFNGNTTLPYLAKVLSIRKALPLQLHPNKEMAAELHKAHPSSFTDPNNKPEIAIALTRFEAFCGFREFRDIETKMRQLEPLRRFLPPGMAEAYSLRQVELEACGASYPEGTRESYNRDGGEAEGVATRCIWQRYVYSGSSAETMGSV